MVCVPAPRAFPIFLCMCLCPSISYFFCPSVFRCPTPLDPIRIPQAAKLPMSIIIIGVGQAEFDGECSSPRCFRAGSRPLGTTFPQRESCWLGVAIWVWVCLFAQGRVCHGVHPRPRPRAVGRRAGHSCLLQPREPGRMVKLERWAGSPLPGGCPRLLASASSSPTRESGLTASVPDGPCRAQVPTLDSPHSHCFSSHSHGGAGWRRCADLLSGEAG